MADEEADPEATVVFKQAALAPLRHPVPPSGDSRPLTESEIAELDQRHQHLLRRLSKQALVYLLFAFYLLFLEISWVWVTLLVVATFPGWFVLLAARRLRADRQAGVVLVGRNAEALGLVWEILPHSRFLWTENGQPARWRSEREEKDAASSARSVKTGRSSLPRAEPNAPTGDVRHRALRPSERDRLARRASQLGGGFWLAIAFLLYGPFLAKSWDLPNRWLLLTLPLFVALMWIWISALRDAWVSIQLRRDLRAGTVITGRSDSKPGEVEWLARSRFPWTEDGEPAAWRRE